MLFRVIVGVVLLVTACGSASSFAAEQDTGQRVDRAVQKAVEKAVEKAAERTVEKAAEQAAERVSEKVATKAAETAVEKAVERVAEKTLEKAAEKAAADAELKAERPDEWIGPTKVNFFVFVLDVDSIDDAEQTFTANVWMRLQWADDRLADLEGSVRQKHLEEVWNPRVIIANRVGLVSKSLPEVVEVHPDGTVIYSQRYTGKLSQPLKLSEFPLDRHVFTVQFAAAGYGVDEVEFVPGPSKINPSIIGGAIARGWSLQDWERVKFEALTLPYEPIEGLQVPGFAARFEAERHVEYYIWQVILPLTVVVVMSWAAFWIGRPHVGVRIGVATSSILTLIAHRFVLASLLPRLPYMTRLDYFTVGSTLLVFMALLVVVSTSYLATVDRDRPAKIVDLAARAAFPAAFLLLFGWFFYW
jgi:hypothetical protein